MRPWARRVGFRDLRGSCAACQFRWRLPEPEPMFGIATVALFQRRVIQYQAEDLALVSDDKQFARVVYAEGGDPLR